MCPIQRNPDTHLPDEGDGADLIETVRHILRSQDALHIAAEKLARENSELRDYVRALLPAALREEGRTVVTEKNSRHREHQALMEEYSMALNECKILNNKVTYLVLTPRGFIGHPKWRLFDCIRLSIPSFSWEQINVKDKKISKLSEIMLEMEKGLISSEKKRAALENSMQVSCVFALS
jgi:hypothetical protein